VNSDNTERSITVKSIDEERLESDHEYRWDHAKEVVGFTDEDRRLIQETEPYLRDEFRRIVEDLYEEFMKYEPTAKFYRNEDGTLDEESYEHRVEGFVLWLERVYDWTENEKYVKYLKDVGEIHTEQLGFDEMVVNPFYMGPTFSILFEEIAAILGDEMNDPAKLAASLTAWQKFFRLQEDFMRSAYKKT
jgi:hypothetical protein